MSRTGMRIVSAVLAAATAVSLGGCASDDDTQTATPAPTVAGTTAEPTASASASASALPNACPADGCRAGIVSIVKNDAGELVVTLEANYTPDISANHFHIYWDTYTSRQVSDDASPRFGVTQGAWVPTDANPYTTGDDVSVSKRGDSHTLCVTAGDRNHDVIDPDLYQCSDVSALL